MENDHGFKFAGTSKTDSEEITVKAWDDKDSKNLDQAIRKFVINTKQKFNVIEKESFRKMLSIARPEYKVQSRRTLCAGIKNDYLYYENLLMDQLQKLSGKIGLTADGWSNKRYRGFFVVTLHFIDEYWRFRSVTIEFKFFPPPHNGPATADLLLETIVRFNLARKFAGITSDNASEMVSAMKQLFQKLNTQHACQLTEKNHIRCVCHIINLCVKDALPFVSAEIEKLRDALKVIRSSPHLKILFVQIQKSMEEKEILQVPDLDIPTRWNSVFLMVNKCVKLKHVFNAIAVHDDAKSKLSEYKMSEEDWNCAENVVKFLEIAFELTVAASGKDYVTISLQPIIYKLLKNHCDSAIAGTAQKFVATENVKKAAKSFLKKLEKYKPNLCGKFANIGMALDPRVTSKLKETREVKEYLRNILISDYDMKPSEATESSDHTKNIFMEINKLSDADSVEQMDELEDFYRLTEQADPNCNLLEWWKTIGNSRFPTLALLAKDTFAVLASSVPAEAAFSEATGFDTKDRHLADESLEQSMKLKSWLNYFNAFK